MKTEFWVYKLRRPAPGAPEKVFVGGYVNTKGSAFGVYRLRAHKWPVVHLPSSRYTGIFFRRKRDALALAARLDAVSGVERVVLDTAVPSECERITSEFLKGMETSHDWGRL